MSQPRVLNASGAEIWGAEFEFTWQPDFVEGLSLNVAYTYLDAEYTKFLDDVTSLQRLAYAGQGCTLIYKTQPRAGRRPGGVAGGHPRHRLAGLPRGLQRQASWSARRSMPCAGRVLHAAPDRHGLDLLAEVNGAGRTSATWTRTTALYFDAYWNCRHPPRAW